LAPFTPTLPNPTEYKRMPRPFNLDVDFMKLSHENARLTATQKRATIL